MWSAIRRRCVRVRGDVRKFFRRRAAPGWRRAPAGRNAVELRYLLPEHERRWPCYRLVLEGKATWAEIKTMTLDEVDLLNLALDAWKAAEREANDNANPKAR
jgi:hypothetical protein